MFSDAEHEYLKAYDRYAEAIFRHCFFRVFSKERAEELTQDTFLKAWQYVRSGNRVEHWQAFLYKIAVNLVIDDSRRKKEESLDALIEGLAISEPSYDTRREMEIKLDADAVVREFARLNPEERKLLTLRYVDGFEPREIAEIMGTTANNVSVKLNHAMKKVRAFV